jgi:acyl carrier protein
VTVGEQENTVNEREIIKAFISSSILKNANDVVIDNGSSLVMSGLVNSLAIVEIITFVEQKFGIDVADEEIDIADFDSVESICKMLERKRLAV